MNSRWQANKIGLLNFWYYDEQEFSFVKGRMLLRGSNGSGKSVTMQSVVPLLLDGNMSPERLDPFGSRDRKMSSYLLEEDDGREERTGYLYLEFKRQESETYLTVGMGIRARRGKPLDKWYFGIADGRRIGKDFYLYKQTDEKVTLSKKELENRIGTGGQVFERQTDYMEYVNRQVFGFETVEEYREMIDLLIQLRTPKLSKDFKPSVINEILSDSLQPLSDEDLRPMSEAIENMDTMNMNLKARQEGRQAAEKINRVFDRYNRLELYEKAEHYAENEKKLQMLEKEAKEQEQQRKSCEQRKRELLQEQTELAAKKDAMDKERDSLSKSDAVGLKHRELELSERITQEEAQFAEKEKQLAGKQEQFVSAQARKRETENRLYEKERDLLGLLEEMQGEAEDMGFDEHTFFREEFQGQMEKPFLFETHIHQMEKTREGIEKGLELLRQADGRQRLVDEQARRREQNQRETDVADRRVLELENLLEQVLNEWKEALYSWNGKNSSLKLSDEQLRKAVGFAENYGPDADYETVRQIATAVWLEKNSQFESELRKITDCLEEWKSRQEQVKQELKEWEEHKEPVPERSEAVQKNRARLVEKQIPFHEFYKVLEFGSKLDKRACDRLEEALLRMGILDALVVEEIYRDQVLESEEGVCDKYLFVQNGRAEHSLLDVLEINDSVNDIFFNQSIVSLLESIAYDGEGTTGILSDGTYQIGAITGTVTGTYEAGYLGSRARERNRQARIAVCKEELLRLDAEISQLEAQCRDLQGQKEQLQEEYQALPGDGDIREAYQMVKKEESRAENLREEGLRLEGQLREMMTVLQQLRREAVEIAGKLYLTCNLETFSRAGSAVQGYRQHVYQLKSGHELYLQQIFRVQELKEQMENLDADMEQIRYEAEQIRRALLREKNERTSIQEQLKLTDYEQIRERLDTCIGWLRTYPALLEACVKEHTQQEERERALEEQKLRTGERIMEGRQRASYLKACYEAELGLDYVEIPEEILADAGKVSAYLEADCQDLSRDAVVQQLNEKYFENRGFLNDYQLMQTELFAELEQEAGKGAPSAKRLDISGRYQGVKVPFYKLIQHLEEDIEELQELIRAGDRELFEDILANTVSRKIRSRIHASTTWVEKMNALMGAMNTSSGLKLSLHWRSRTAEQEDQLDTKELLQLLKKDYRLMREEEAARLSMHFRSKVEQARRGARDSGGLVSFYQVMKETLDYRKWFEFQLFAQKSGERVRELTNSVFGTFSGGEKAMSMYVPLFSAVVAKYQGGRADAPRIISLDEAFAGVDNKNIRDMFRLMTEFQFDFILNSQVLWGDCDTLDALAIYQLIRPENARFVTVMPYLWNGRQKELLDNEREMEERAAGYTEEEM